MADRLPTSDVAGEQGASLEALARLATALSRPFSTFPESRFNPSPLSRKQVEALSGHPSFREPLERFFCAQLTGKRFTISRKQATRMPRSRAGRLAILMMTEPLGEVERAALLVAGAALHRRVLDSASKSQREHLRGALGSEAFHVATLEAPMLYPALAGYASERLCQSVLSEPQDAARIRLVGLGARLLAAAASYGSRTLAKLALKRLSAGTGPSVKSFSRHDLQTVIRLLQRRMSPWAAFIG